LCSKDPVALIVFCDRFAIMAQGAVASLPVNGTRTDFTDAELRDVLECEKILRFRDAVLSGTHPRIKAPQHLIGKFNHSRNTSSPNNQTSRAPPSHTTHSTPNGNDVVLSHSPTQYWNKVGEAQGPTYGRSSGPVATATKSTRSEIDPILLSKSDELVKAEIQLRRQRLERALREQIEQRRLAQKTLLQTSESLPDFDITEVLHTALRLVQPVTTGVGTSVAEAAAAATPASDSFDENTFYSSQHDTPEPVNDISRESGEASDVAIVEPLATPAHISSDEESTDIETGEGIDGRGGYEAWGQTGKRGKKKAQPLGKLAAAKQLQTALPVTAADSVFAKNLMDVDAQASQATSTDGTSTDEARIPNAIHNGRQSYSDDTVQHQRDQEIISATVGAFLDQAFPQPPEPLIHGHDLSPVAPQPSRVSPLASRNHPVAFESQIAGEAPSAQVLSLRTEAGISSTDSSPQGSKRSNRKNKAQKAAEKSRARRASGRQAPDSPGVYIKPEPRSPSPFGGDALSRPAKRQRQTIPQAPSGLNYDEPNIVAQDETPTSRYKENQPPVQYTRRQDAYDVESREHMPLRRSPRREDDYRRISGVHSRRLPSPGSYALPYSPSDPTPIRTASRAMEVPRPYHESQVPMRMGGRMEDGRDRSRSPILRDRGSPLVMGPPRVAPRRIVVDAQGREYFVPPPSTIRQSIAPDARYGDEEIVYDRAPRRVATEVYDDGLLYRRASPTYAGPRRVIYQQEPELIDYRQYREREYSTRPVAMPPPPREEFIQIRGPAVERRQMSHFEEVPREYVQRLPSVRPEARYELPREYAPRTQSVRPEPIMREYGSVPQGYREVSVRPEGGMVRREFMPPPPIEGRYREISVRPDVEVVRREYMRPPVHERYEVTRASARPEEAYTEEGARVVYR
jgi:hypothetical protein